MTETKMPGIRANGPGQARDQKTVRPPDSTRSQSNSRDCQGPFPDVLFRAASTRPGGIVLALPSAGLDPEEESLAPEPVAQAEALLVCEGRIVAERFGLDDVAGLLGGASNLAAVGANHRTRR
jgi:hypothetical protein